MSEAGPKPLTRQRSKWEEWEANDSVRVVDEIITDAGGRNISHWWRNVHDGQLRVTLSEDPVGWHLSISHAKQERKKARPVPGRYPSWDEIADARYEFLPLELDFVMHLPPPEDYVALHDTTFHLHEHPERARGDH